MLKQEEEIIPPLLEKLQKAHERTVGLKESLGKLREARTHLTEKLQQEETQKAKGSQNGAAAAKQMLEAMQTSFEGMPPDIMEKLQAVVQACDVEHKKEQEQQQQQQQQARSQATSRQQ